MPLEEKKSPGMDGTIGVIYRLPPIGASDEEVLADVRDFAQCCELIDLRHKPWATQVLAQREVLDCAGLPSIGGFWQFIDGDWVQWTGTDAFITAEFKVRSGQDAGLEPSELDRGTFRSLPALAAARFPATSPEVYAATIVDLADRIDLARAFGFMDAVEALIFELGERCSQQRTILYADADWVLGKEVREGGRKGGHTRREEKEMRSETVVTDVQAAIQMGYTKMQAYEYVARRRGISVTSVRRWYATALARAQQ